MIENKDWKIALGEPQGSKDLPFHEKKKNPVEEIKQGMKIVQETTAVAEEISGSRELREERDAAQEALAQEREETHKKEIADIKEMLKRALENKDVPAVKELERRLEETKEAYYKEHLDSLQREIREAQKGKPDKSLAQQIKEMKEISRELGLGPGETSSGTPPAILLELKKMEYNLQVKLEEMKDDRERRSEEMKDDRERRDKEWQLTVRKWDEERDLRREEARGKYGAEQERTNLLKSAIDRGARIIGRAVIEEEPAPPGQPISYRLEADEGEMGEFTCPKCSSTVLIAPDTVTAICAKCGFRANIERKSKPVGDKSAMP